MVNLSSKIAFILCLSIFGQMALAESNIIDNIKRVIPVGTYQGSTQNGPCTVEVMDIENGITVTVLQESNKALIFPFTYADVNEVIAEDFRESVAFLEYTKKPEDQISGTYMRRLNVNGFHVSVLEKRNGLFSTPKSAECQLSNESF